MRAGELFYRDIGAGNPPIVILHGGWGYDFYPFDDAIAGLRRRIVIPDRSGYGQSLPKRTELPDDFHAMYARETEGLLDTLGIASSFAGQRRRRRREGGRSLCAVGHSDGAIIAVHMAIAQPQRYAGIIVQALHLDREKPASREFFTQSATSFTLAVARGSRSRRHLARSSTCRSSASRRSSYTGPMILARSPASSIRCVSCQTSRSA